MIKKDAKIFYAPWWLCALINFLVSPKMAKRQFLKNFTEFRKLHKVQPAIGVIRFLNGHFSAIILINSSVVPKSFRKFAITHETEEYDMLVCIVQKCGPFAVENHAHVWGLRKEYEAAKDAGCLKEYYAFTVTMVKNVASVYSDDKERKQKILDEHLSEREKIFKELTE